MNADFKVTIAGKTCVLSLESMVYNQQEFVDSSIYRLALLDSRKSHPDFKDYVLIDEFMNDLNNQLSYMKQNFGYIDLSENHFRAACEYACSKHIAEKGRLFITDLFSYVDIYAILLNSYFGYNKQQIATCYVHCVKCIGTKHNASIKCPTPFGAVLDFNRWAELTGI